MTTTSLNDSDISARLAGHVARLSEVTSATEDATSTYVLKHLQPRLSQGLVRIAVIGITGAGKSTTINALTESLVLPENPSTSSPIPVWIGYHQGEPAVEVYRNENGSVTKECCTVPEFQRKYCYNQKDITDKDRTRYNSVEFGAVCVCSPILRGNVTLIDTLGISATTVDSRKTIRVLEEGVDAVIFITGKSKLNLEEMRFLYRHVLGCTSTLDPDAPAVSVPRPISPENVLFVSNNFFGVPSKVAFTEGIRTFYRESSLEMTEEQIEACATENVFFIDALKARMGRLGIYPYADRAPEGCSQREREVAQELEDEERENLDSADQRQLLAQSGIGELAEAVRQLGHRLGYGENSVAAKRIQELVEVVDGVIQAADNRITGKQFTITQLQNKQDEFDQIKRDDEADQKTLSESMDALGEEYVASFKRLLTDVTGDLVTDCAGRALRMPMPPSFRSQYRAYLKMDKKGREQYLNAMLPDAIRKTYEYCIDQMLQALDERQTDDYVTPFAVMEKTKEFMQEQEVLFRSRIDSLKAAGAEELGMFFPQAIIVKNLFDKLGQDLQEKVKEIISDACTTGGKAFEDNMGKYIKGCSIGLVKNVVGLVFQDQAAKWLWSNITRSMFQPLAEAIVNGIPGHAEKTIYIQTTKAFRNTRDEICKNHMQLFASLNVTMAQLQQSINTAGNAAARTEEEMKDLKKTCEEIKKDILSMQYQLQHT